MPTCRWRSTSLGRRLAKRDGAVTLSDLAALGIGPPQVLGSIAESLGWPAPNRLADLLSVFDPARLPRHPWVVDSEPG